MLANRFRSNKASMLLLGLALASSTLLAKSQTQEVPGNSAGYLVKEVAHELRMLPYYTVFDDLSFRVNGGNVTLEGAVTNPTLKKDAENVVKHIEGVQSVTNNIKVLPLSDMDRQIRRAVYRAIYSDPSFTKYGFQAYPSIHIIVDNGHVTLTGVVDNETDKNLANIRANSVSGVFSVDNQLRVVKNS